MPKFNLVGVAVNLAIGWFVMAFIQAGVRLLFAGKGGTLMPLWKSIALFQDRPAALVNAAIILVIWLVTVTLWFTLRAR